MPVTRPTPSPDEILEIVAGIVGPAGGQLELEPETPLLSTGILDSLSLMELQSALDDRFDVQLRPEDLGYDNGDTAEQMASSLARAAR